MLVASPQAANAGDPDQEVLDNLNLITSSGPLHKVPVAEIYRFLLGVIAPFKWWLALAYALLISGIVANMKVADLVGDAINALQAGRPEDFERLFWHTTIVLVASLALHNLGLAAMQLFGVKAMQLLFTQLFSHLLDQELELFQRLTVAEISSRTGGDSLSIQLIITTTLFRIVSGVLQAVVAMVFLIMAAQSLYAAVPGMEAAAPIGLLAQLGFAVCFGVWLGWPLHRQARQALGRVYGFLFDTFGQVETVQTLGMVTRQKVSSPTPP